MNNIFHANEEPSIPRDFLLKLNKMYPEKVFETNITMPELFEYNGVRRLIKKLNHIYHKQTGQHIEKEL